VTIDFCQCDVSKNWDVVKAIDHIRGEIAGIVHCAGVLDDALLASQEWREQENVLDPKIRGAFNLHHQSQGCELDFFVVFSSVASFFGAVGQTAYAAANGFLDGLMTLRRGQGLPGLAIAWPAWAGTGMANRNDRAGLLYWESRGVASIDRVLGAHLFGLFTNSTLSHIVVAPRRQEANAQSAIRAKKEGATIVQSSIVEAIMQTGKSERLALLEVVIAEQLVIIFGDDAKQFAFSDSSFREIGLDSFQLIELRSKLSEQGLAVSTEVMLSNASTMEIAKQLLEQLSRSEQPAHVGSAPSTFREKLLATQKMDRLAMIELLIAEQVQRLSSNAAVNFQLSELSFRDVGLDSFQLIELRSNLSMEGVDISTETLLSDKATRAIAEQVLVNISTPKASLTDIPVVGGALRDASDSERIGVPDHNYKVVRDGASASALDGAGGLEGAWDAEYELEAVIPLMSAFINGGWTQERYRTGLIDMETSSIVANVSAEKYAMPADGVYHLPLFQAFLWVELLGDLYVQASGRFEGQAGAHLRRFKLELGERITRPTDITPQLYVRGGDKTIEADFRITGDGAWKGTATFDVADKGDAVFRLLPGTDRQQLDSELAQACLDHYWSRLKHDDFAASMFKFRRGRVQTVARWDHGGSPVSPYTLVRWGSQLALVYAHWRLGLARKPRNESYVVKIDMSISPRTLDATDLVLSFEPQKEIIDNEICYLTGVFRAGDFATMSIQLSVPMKDVGVDSGVENRVQASALTT
jgi:aryl carrier-like protein